MTKKIKCFIHEGKYCNEPFCLYNYHIMMAHKYYDIWKHKLKKELEEYNRTRN